MHSANFTNLPGIPSCCPRFETGFGLGYDFGFFTAIPLAKSWELEVDAAFVNLNGKLTRDEPQVVADANGNYVNGQFEHTVNATLSSLGLMPLIAFRVSDQLRLKIGIRAAYLMQKTFSEQEEVISPSNGVFIDSTIKQRVRNQYSGTIQQAATLDLAGIIGASYDLPLNNDYTMFLVPQVYYNLGFTNIATGTSWTVNGLNIGLALRYALENYSPKIPPPLPAPPPLPNPPPPPAPPVLNAFVEAVGVDNNGNESKVPELIIEEFQRKRTHPILNYIFFDDNSTELPERYNRITEQERAQFSVKGFIT